MKKPKVEFTKNKNGEIIGAKINEQLSEQEFIKHFIKPEINQALQQQRQEIIEKIKELEYTLYPYQVERSEEWLAGYNYCKKPLAEDIKKIINSLK